MGRYRKLLVVPGLLLIALCLCTEESNAQRGGGPPDPEAMWARMSQGKDSIDLNQNPYMKSMIERGGDPLPPNGILTKEQFVTGMQKKMAAGGGGFGKGSKGGGMGGPGMDGAQPTIIVNGAVVQPAPGMGGAGNTDFIANRFQQMDLNKDGYITMDEASDRMKSTFPQIDRNGDGRIDLGEYTAYTNERMAGGGRGGPPSMGGDPNMQQQFQFNQQQPGGFPGAPQFDTSGGRGGRQNREEDDTTRVAVHRFGKMPKGLPDWFEKLDTDMDGMVGLYEWRRASGKTTKEFVDMDLNGDGYLTADEWIRYTKMSIEKKDDGESPGMRMTFGTGSSSGGRPSFTTAPTTGGGPPSRVSPREDRPNKDEKREKKALKGS